jgi:hypothetical protein
MIAEMTMSTIAQNGRGISRSSIICLAAFGIAAVAIIYTALITGPARWETMQRLRAQQLAGENRDYCAKLKMPEGTADFATCAMYLNEIRKRQADRSAAEAAGMI